MDKILKRDDFINDIYNPMMEQKLEEKKYQELVAINEGLLKTLFGMAKNMFKKDWATIKGDSNIIKIYKEMDDALTGFSTMKLSKKSECNQIRQALVDFACDWYDYKMNHAKDTDEDPKPAKSMKFKDETLKSNLDAAQNKIKSIAKGDEQMIKWADILMQDMKTVINRSILADIQDEETKKELEKQIQEDLKDPEKVNKMMEEWQNDQLTEIQKEREKLISDVQASPIQAELLGDKAIQNLCGEFEKIRKAKNEAKLDLFKNDSTFGFKSIFEEDDYSNKGFKTSYKLMDSFYTALNGSDVMAKFKETPGQSVQAMCISINAFIKNCVYGSQDYGKALPLMAKCAIISNGLVSYNLPLNDEAVKDMTSDKAGNYFTDIAKIITDGQLKDAKGKEIKLPDDFKKNADTLLNKIVDEAKKLKEQADKDYDEQLKKLKLDKKDDEPSLEK